MRPSTLPISATGRLLLDHHAQMDMLINQLRHEIHQGDWAVCQSTWGRFERHLVDHIDVEERFLLPIFEHEYPDEAAALHEEHMNIRRLLEDMAVRLELHNLREEHVRSFFELLKAHAVREEVLFYRWAHDLPPDVAGTLARTWGLGEKCA